MWNLKEDFVSLQFNYADSKEVLQYDINKKFEKSPRNKVEPFSATFMQNRTQDTDEMQRTHFIQVEGLP